MGDKLLRRTIAVSIGLHLVVLAFVGASYAARSIDPDNLKLVQVKVVTLPDEPKSVLEQVKPAAKPAPLESAEVRVPPPEKMQTAPPPRPRPTKISPPKNVTPQTKPGLLSTIRDAIKGTPDTASNKPPGDPGGELNTGSGSKNGQDLGGTGQTPTGWVPGSPGGKGTGSGSGEGTGKPEPVPNATQGPGKEPAPPPPPPPPPPDVEVRVCTASGMLPGPNCEHTAVKSYRPGRQPVSKCNVCKPRHVSTLADRSVPELISGSKRPKYPEAAKRRDIEGSVTVEYTINTEGRVTAVKVSSSSGNSDLDRAATDCVNSRKYKPAVQGGIPRNYRKRETFHFALD